MLKKILIGLVVIIGGFSAFVSFQPSHFRVERSIAISATPAAVFEHVNDLHKWQAWSPWAKLDPKAKTTYEGPTAGTGAVFNWDGNKEVGAGRMTIVESHASNLIRFNLEFEKPFKGTNSADFTFKSDGDKTVVTWGMEGDNNFMFKAVGLFMDCDKMVGSQFEKGLADLKSLTEKSGRE